MSLIESHPEQDLAVTCQVTQHLIDEWLQSKSPPSFIQQLKFRDYSPTMLAGKLSMMVMSWAKMTDKLPQFWAYILQVGHEGTEIFYRARDQGYRPH